MTTEKIWLVEIRVKDWVHVPEGQSRTAAYEEVAIDTGSNEFAARHAGFAQFEKRIKYEPIQRRRFKQRGLPLTDYCAPEAVEI